MRTVLIAILGAAMYATLRYNVFGGVAWSDWPVYVLNKILALSSLLLLAIALGRNRLVIGQSRSGLLAMAGICASMHVILSLALLSPNYYGNLFVQGRLTAPAGLSLVAGALATVLLGMSGKRRPGYGEKEMRRTLGLVCLVVALHVLLQGFRGWLTPSKWPGLMPPVTLISCLVGLVAFAIGLRAKKNK